MAEEQMICARCNVPMGLEKASFKYMSFSFSVDLLTCPICKQIYIPEELVNGKMASVEMELEEK